MDLRADDIEMILRLLAALGRARSSATSARFTAARRDCARMCSCAWLRRCHAGHGLRRPLGAHAGRIAARSNAHGPGNHDGIGFLGAGVIVKEGLNVRGLTTAASIWITAGIGVLAGVGLYLPMGSR